MKNLVILALGCALLAACRPDDVVECGPQAQTLADLRAASPQTQLFVINPNQPQTVVTQGGATLTIPPNRFYWPDGRLFSGQAVLRVREIYSVPDMLLADMPTNTTTGAGTREMLLSGGEFNLQLWQAGVRLRLLDLGPGSAAPPAPLVLTSPVPTAGLDTTRMLLWNQRFTALLAPGRDTAGWSAVLSSNYTPTSVPASTAGFYSAVLPLDSIGWWNIDQFWHAYQSRTPVVVRVMVPGTTAAMPTKVYFRPIGYNGLARCLPLLGTSSWEFPLPSGADVVAVVIQERGGRLYYGTQRVMAAAGLVLTPPLEALAAAEIVRRIRLL